MSRDDYIDTPCIDLICATAYFLYLAFCTNKTCLIWKKDWLHNCFTPPLCSCCQTHNISSTPWDAIWNLVNMFGWMLLGTMVDLAGEQVMYCTPWAVSAVAKNGKVQSLPELQEKVRGPIDTLHQEDLMTEGTKERSSGSPHQKWSQAHSVARNWLSAHCVTDCQEGRSIYQSGSTYPGGLAPHS